jgi:hypothetical protein
MRDFAPGYDRAGSKRSAQNEDIWSQSAIERTFVEVSEVPKAAVSHRNKAILHSITSSARASTVGGLERTLNLNGER